MDIQISSQGCESEGHAADSGVAFTNLRYVIFIYIVYFSCKRKKIPHDQQNHFQVR